MLADLGILTSVPLDSKYQQSAQDRMMLKAAGVLLLALVAGANAAAEVGKQR